MNGKRLLLAANGHGPELAGRAADVAACMEPPEGVLSAGFCGALAPDLVPGGIVVASRIEAPATGASFEARLPASDRRFASGPVFSVDRVVRTAEEKQAMRLAGAVAVEMEAAAVAQRAARWNLPFYCVRAVTDTCDEDLGLDLNAARDGRGRIRTGRIVADALRHPAFVPELLMLWRRSRLAAEELGNFLADCRFY